MTATHGERSRTDGPKWLLDLPHMRDIPLRELLDGSAYYPACGYDGRVVQYLAAITQSFVLVDACLPKIEVQAAIEQQGAFKGYRLWGLRSLDLSELEGDCAWTAAEIVPDLDGDLKRYAHRYVGNFALWAIFERLQALSESHGPTRFSLLFIGGEGVDIFQRLYYSNGVAPTIVAIIQPGSGFGNNWTFFEDPKQILGRVIMSNPSGVPRYLICGGAVARFEYKSWLAQYRRPCWPTHDQLIRFWGGRSMDWMLGLWSSGT